MADGARGERRLYRDLSRLLANVRDRPFGEVEDAIEARFRRYLREAGAGGGGTLAVTLRWHLPEGAASFALYATHLEVEGVGPAPVKDGRREGNVIAFPRRQRSR